MKIACSTNSQVCVCSLKYHTVPTHLCIPSIHQEENTQTVLPPPTTPKSLIGCQLPLHGPFFTPFAPSAQNDFLLSGKSSQLSSSATGSRKPCQSLPLLDPTVLVSAFARIRAVLCVKHYREINYYQYVTDTKTKRSSPLQT